MKNFTRRENAFSPTQEHPPEDWPSGALNPDSDFFVPEHLRQHYRVDRAREAHLFGIGNSHARDVSTDLHPLDASIIGMRYTAEELTQAGLDPRRRNDPMVRREFYARQAAKITQRDRDLYLHKWRLQNAATAEVHLREGQERAKKHRAEHTCQVCGEYHKLTRDVRFAAADDPHAEGFEVFRATVCPACMQLVRQAINDRAAEALTAAGKTRGEAAAELVRTELDKEGRT